MCNPADDYEALPPTASPLAHMVAGALAGIAEHSVMYPIDVIKTRLQILAPQSSPNQAFYTGTFNAIRTINSVEGIRALWRGLSTVLVGAGPAHAVYFGTYEQCKSLAIKFSSSAKRNERIDEHNIDPVLAACAGASATVVQDALMNPFDVIKQRMQSFTGSQYRSMLHCASRIYMNEGLRAFYISYPTTLTMSIPFHSIHFATYEAISTLINPNRQYQPMSHILAGAGGGALAAALTTPMDVCKTLLQTKGDQKSDMVILRANGMQDAVKIIYDRYGVLGFWKGVVPRVLSHMPGTAILFVTYEYIKSTL